MTATRILVVEDELIVALDLRTRLTRMGYQVVGVMASGPGAIRHALTSGPDLVLMDVRLAGPMDGIEAAGTIRQQLDVPIVYLTALSDEETLERARLTEPFGYLVKPFEERELRATIEMALYRHRTEAALRDKEKRLSLYARRLETLHAIDRAMLAADSPAVIAQAALRRIHDLVDCARVSVVVCNCQENTAKVLAVHGQDVPALAPGTSFSALSQVFAPMLWQGRPQLIADLAGVAQPALLAQALLASGLRSCAIVPLTTQGELIGSLNLDSERPGAFDERGLEIVTEVADSLAMAIHHARLHNDLQKHAVELERRNQELDAFAHTVAHDLKEPLAVVIGFADVLRSDWQQIDAQELERLLATMGRTGQRMNRIVDELLLLAEVRELPAQPQALDMGCIVAAARERLSHTLAEYQAELSMPAVWPQALGYGPWVEEVWANYLSNAAKYGGRPPRIELGFSLPPESGAAPLMVDFWVQDNGPGLAADARDRLFLPFSRLSQVRAQGHGLGLSIVRRIVEKLGGQVAVASEGAPGRGSRFSFSLPLAPEAPALAQPTRRRIDDPPGGS